MEGWEMHLLSTTSIIIKNPERSVAEIHAHLQQVKEDAEHKYDYLWRKDLENQ